MSQSFQPSVYNAAGGTGTVTSGGSTWQIYYNIGEPIATDEQSSQARFTQGFLQPDIVSYNGAMQVNTYTTAITCQDANNAAIILNVSGANTPFRYTWYKNGVALADTNSSLQGIGPGIYTYTVSNSLGITKVDTITVTNSTELCTVIANNGFTPNGDGINDHFHLANIENFPDNKVSIFNRWGNIVWEITGYNNSGNAWSGEDKSGHTLSAGTYFFIVEADGKKTKGWVELLR